MGCTNNSAFTVNALINMITCVTFIFLILHLIFNKKYFRKMCILVRIIALLFCCAPSVWRTCAYWRSFMSVKFNRTLVVRIVSLCYIFFICIFCPYRNALFTTLKWHDWLMVSQAQCTDATNQYSNSLLIIFIIDNNRF